MFDQLQMRQAELESSQSHLDSVEARSTELQYQLREAEDRVDILTEELAEMNRKIINGHSSSSAEEIAQILSETEGKYEARIGDLRSKMRALEKERHAAEDEWSRNLQERGRELERLRGIVEGKDREYAESVRGKTEMEDRLFKLETDNQRLKTQIEAEQVVILGLQKDIDWLKDAEVRSFCPSRLGHYAHLTLRSQAAVKQDRDDAHTRIETLERQLDEMKGHESTIKASNKVMTSRTYNFKC